MFQMKIIFLFLFCHHFMLLMNSMSRRFEKKNKIVAHQRIYMTLKPIIIFTFHSQKLFKFLNNSTGFLYKINIKFSDKNTFMKVSGTFNTKIVTLLHILS